MHIYTYYTFDRVVCRGILLLHYETQLLTAMVV
jgi:hypothetical protein